MATTDSLLTLVDYAARMDSCKYMFGFFSLSSAMVGPLMTFYPQFAWRKMFGVKASVATSIVTTVYGCALIGEFGLYAAAALSSNNVLAAYAFMVPYKLTSVASLLILSRRGLLGDGKDARRIALNWSIPLLMGLVQLSFAKYRMASTVVTTTTTR